MKKRLLYIGNKLSEKGKTPTAIDTLGLAFEQENFTVFYASQKQNQFLRFLDIIITTLFKCNKVDFVIIDTYSTKNFYFALVVSQICRLFKTKYIPILHGGNLPDRLKKNPYLSRLIFKYAYKNVVPSNYLKQEFSKHFNYNLVYIPNTIEIEKYHLQFQ